MMASAHAIGDRVTTPRGSLVEVLVIYEREALVVFDSGLRELFRLDELRAAEPGAINSRL